jgi:hypothetical protein
MKHKNNAIVNNFFFLKERGSLLDLLYDANFTKVLKNKDFILL